MQWHVKPGDRVSQFDAICEVQSDKAAVEVPRLTIQYLKGMQFLTPNNVDYFSLRWDCNYPSPCGRGYGYCGRGKSFITL